MTDTRAIQIDILLAGVVNPSSSEYVANGTVYFYEAGTTTAKSVWTEKEKTNAYASYTLSGIGSCQLYGEGNYKLVVKDENGDTVKTLDNIRLEFPYYGIRPVSGTVSQLSQDDFLRCDTTSSNTIVNALPASQWTRPLKLKRVAGSNNIVFTPNGSETIDNNATLTITDDSIVEIISNGSNLESAGFRSSTSSPDGNTKVDVANGSVTTTISGTETEVVDSSGITLESGDLTVSTGDIIVSSGDITRNGVSLSDISSVEILTHKTLTSPKINEDVALTATATEINTACDGITATASEINTACDGITATATEINTACDGITATASEINAVTDISSGLWTNNSSANASSVTLNTGGVEITTLALGTCKVGDFFFVNYRFAVTKGATAGTTYITVLTNGGSGSAKFSGSWPHLEQFNQEAGQVLTKCASAIMEVTTAGTITLILKGYSNGSNGTVNVGDGSLDAYFMRKT